ncbi:PP2C family protein-serine/threonine phosphatase [Paenibacillus hexagrammi]|uniref:SpoIIE family protein phosphatase n=1 Tax=Paenibacillus hexagrammi TaxID=2908839 RepID=A0ABY3SH01_9BACL|nr:SpoIIE family protein phosphatase [Paenibacillus sp. YPD9-1]UJF32217.1 SpoIIE family protein phosphatase [Paenibacillus sp. YPD9-1]
MRKENSDFQTAFLSEAGTFLNNKDYFAYAELDDLACWVLADGLDNDLETESAMLAVQSVLGSFSERPTLSRSKLKRYVKQAHKLLMRESKRVRLKASLTLVATDYKHAVWVSAGHTRFYHFRQGKLLARSVDQSLAQQLVHTGKIRRDDADRHEEKHNLLNYLGKPDGCSPYASRKARLEDGDILLLCSLGLWEGVHHVEMLDAIEESEGPEEFVDTLEEVMLSRQGRTIHNYTAAAIYAGKVYKEQPNKRNWGKWVKTAAMLLIPLVLFGSGAIVYKVRAANQKAAAVASMVESEQKGDKEAQEGDYAKAAGDYSVARNAAIKLNDKVHTKLIADKLQLADLVVDGDDAMKDGDYEKAVSKYEAAEKEAKSHDGFDMSGVSENKKKAQTYLLVLGMIQQGDMKLAAKDYAGAKETYEDANKQAVLANFAQGTQQISLKMNEVDNQMKSIKKSEQQAKGEDMEKEGDKQMEAEEYQQAIATYTAVQGIYQQAELLDKVLSVERKILDAQTKLNPPQPSSSPAADGAPGSESSSG